MRARFSIVIPYYGGLAHIGEAVESVLSQGRDDVEIIIVDGRDPQCSGDKLDDMFAGDARVRAIHRDQNGGTLRARRDGVLASAGEHVLLLDQDDALAEGALAAIDAELGRFGADILHFGAHVVAESAEATAARDGMESFLVPPARELAGAEILANNSRGRTASTGMCIIKSIAATSLARVGPSPRTLSSVFPTTCTSALSWIPAPRVTVPWGSHGMSTTSAVEKRSRATIPSIASFA